MSAPNIFYVLRRDSKNRYLGSVHQSTYGGEEYGMMVNEIDRALRFSSPYDLTLLKHLAKNAPADKTYRIVRVTEVPGATKREVIPEGQAYDPKAVQYAYAVDQKWWIDQPKPSRFTSDLQGASLFPTHHDLLCDLTTHETRHGYIYASVSRIVPVRITTTPSTFTEEVVK